MSEPTQYPELIVGALLVDPRGRVLVARFSKITGHYAVPGGHVEYGETMARALVREMEEETGLTPTRFHLLQVTERICPPLYKDGRHHLVYLDFVVDGWEGTLQLDGEELTDGRWLLPGDALALRLTHTTRRLIEYYAEVGPGGPVRYLPDGVHIAETL
jgi:8-oxo-dGTP pyrophosphatase MutT (NUDIX family)